MMIRMMMIIILIIITASVMDAVCTVSIVIRKYRERKKEKGRT